MKKFTINNFSGGIQESLSATDFSPRQWAQLKGIVPRNELTFESQWAIQQVRNSQTGFQAIFPLASDSGLYLTGIKTNGTIWWTTAPAATDLNATAAGGTWYELTGTLAENRTWVNSSNPADHIKITVAVNQQYRFICAVPFQASKYVKDVDSSAPTNLTLDRDASGAPRAIASAVLINTRERSAGQQALVLYVDNATSTVKAVVFPAPRRIPYFKYSDAGGSSSTDSTGTTITSFSNFIAADFLLNDERTETDTMPTWPFSMSSVDAPDVAQHPFTYRDINGLVNPGTGLMPRANVGCMKGDLLILGDVEWRRSFGTGIEVKSSVAATFGPTKTKTLSQSPQPINFPDTALNARVVFNNGPGIMYLSDESTVTYSSNTTFTVVKRAKSGTTVTLTVRENVSTVAVGDKIKVTGVGPKLFDTQEATITAKGTSGSLYYIQYTRAVSATRTTVNSSGTVLVTPTGTRPKIKVEVGEYQPIPDSWTIVYALATISNTTAALPQNFNRALHLLNDNNTGPHRGAFYYSSGDLDAWDPRSLIIPGKTDVRIAGMHALDDTIIIITTAGSEGDGVFRVRGYLSKLHPYDPTEQPDPTAVRIELVKGGVGAAPRSDDSKHLNYSCVWSEAGVVVFIDRLGGVFYTDGQSCDRLDRYGPRQPAKATTSDHVAALGKHLFLYRDGRLLCFTMLGSSQGTGSGCWTELSLGSITSVKSMIGIREDLYFIDQTGTVRRIATGGGTTLNVERGCVDTVPVTQTVSTATLGSEDEHDKTNWHRFGMTFTTPTTATVGTVRINGGPALVSSFDELGPLDPVSYTLTLNRVYSNTGILNEFVVPAGIGAQASASATVTFTGYVVLQSASFWTTGRSPRNIVSASGAGDQ
jgi:hypothetical protein